MFGRRNWVTLEDYQGHEINEMGEVRNKQNGQILKTSINQTGVRYVSLRNTTIGRYENRAVGTLVADTFCPGRGPDAETVLHLDGNTENNSAENLMWSSRWHAMAYHQEINNTDVRTLRRAVVDAAGRRFNNVLDAARATGCLPSAIDYAARYNDNLAANEHINFVHKVYPGGHVFRTA